MNKSEIVDLMKAWLAISIAFGIILYTSGKSIQFSIFAGLLIVGLSFLLHELAHRTVARYYNKHAEFKANNKMLLIAIVMSFFGFIIAAPGAVHVSGFVSREREGKIASAGPFTNIILALISIPFLFVIPTIAYYSLIINSWLAVFNLIPFQGFDGQKILGWSKVAYSIMGVLSLILIMTYWILPNFILI